MLDFKNWLLTEHTQIPRHYSNTHQVIDFGTMGWWRVYSATKTDIPQLRRIMTLKEYINLPEKEPDRVLSKFKLNEIQYIMNKSATSLSSIGIPRMRSVCVFADQPGKNTITGGGIGGSAWQKAHISSEPLSHGFTAKEPHMGTIIHEHAHMMYFNMPRYGKKAFSKWWYNNVKSYKPSDEELAAVAKDVLPPFKQEDLDEQIESSWYSFKEKLENTLQSDIQTYLDLRSSADDPQKTIANSLLNTFRAMVDARLKKQVTLTNYRHEFFNQPPGTIVTVENLDKIYALNFYAPNSSRYEARVSKPVENLLKVVEFDTDLLYDKQKEKLKKFKIFAKKPPFSFLANTNMKDEIDKVFEYSAKEITKFSRGNGGIYPNFNHRYSYEQMFGKNRRFYSTWAAIIRLRYKKGLIDTVDGIKKAYIDTIKKTMLHSKRNSLADKTPEHLDMEYIRMFVKRSTPESPEGKHFRNIVHQKGITPTAYAAANEDELWAETIEALATGLRKVTPELKKFITYVAGGMTNNPSH